MASGMTESPKRALIIGNGPSRKGIDLRPFMQAMPSFGCNMIIEDVFPTYVVAIDEPIIKRLWYSSFPFHRILTPPEIERWEPAQLHPGKQNRPRSNAGINAMLEAVKRGYKDLYLIGLDFMINDTAMQLGNVYAGKPGYETTITHDEALGRVNYFKYVATNNVDIRYTFVFPTDIMEKKNFFEVPENVNFISYTDFMGIVNSG